mmetsp:Transcript_79857/g.171150  ORF Transcript_79857/g.171150 Transcript_79857/m.171150 type:complete len:188 (+) Transcript_79857:86-649(+)
MPYRWMDTAASLHVPQDFINFQGGDGTMFLFHPLQTFSLARPKTARTPEIPVDETPLGELSEAVTVAVAAPPRKRPVVSESRVTSAPGRSRSVSSCSTSTGSSKPASPTVVVGSPFRSFAAVTDPRAFNFHSEKTSKIQRWESAPMHLTRVLSAPGFRPTVWNDRNPVPRGLWSEKARPMQELSLSS